ncbi:unnamed protein product [Discosporangium mesarthrocarpum]
MSKFDKFTMVDPLGGEEEESMQEMVANEVNKRMGKATEELREKYETEGVGFQAASDAQPTGAAYARARKEKAEARRRVKEQRQAVEQGRRVDNEELAAQLAASVCLSREGDEEEQEQDSDDELLRGLDEDPAIRMIRDQRLKEMKKEHDERAENIAKGHGQYREIAQDEFLPEVTGSAKVVVHFYHNEFHRCKIMDARLAEVAPRHLETKIIKINAEKAPFFVNKLQVRVLPTVVCFINGVAVHSIVGFEGLTEGLPPDRLDEWPASNLARELALAKVISYSTLDGGLGNARNGRGAGHLTGSIRAGASVNDGEDGEFSDNNG